MTLRRANLVLMHGALIFLLAGSGCGDDGEGEGGGKRSVRRGSGAKKAAEGVKPPAARRTSRGGLHGLPSTRESSGWWSAARLSSTS